MVQHLRELVHFSKKVGIQASSSGIEKWLCEHLLKPLDSFADGTKSFTYAQLEYLKAYVSALETFVESAELSNRLVTDHLLLHGYNDAAFCGQMASCFRRVADESCSQQEMLDYLKEELKLIRQLQPSPPLSYDDSRADAHEVLSNWLEEEIRFLEKTETVNKLSLSSKKEDVPIQLNLSVYELALGTRLLMDAKLIEENSFPKVAKYLTANFRTHKKENLSLESFRRKSYEFEKSVVNKIKDKIILLMNLAQQF